MTPEQKRLEREKDAKRKALKRQREKEQRQKAAAAEGQYSYGQVHAISQMPKKAPLPSGLKKNSIQRILN